MKTFSTSGTGSQQTLSEIESDKMPIYDSLTDVTADLANLEVGQIGATKGTGSELSAPVDTVQSGNMHAVTSNAVAEALDNYSGCTETEQECGKYFNTKRYRKTYVFDGVAVTANTPQVLQNNFEIPVNLVVGMEGFAVNANNYINDLGLYMAVTNNQLCIYPKLGDTNFTIVVTVYYIK